MNRPIVTLLLIGCLQIITNSGVLAQPPIPVYRWDAGSSKSNETMTDVMITTGPGNRIAGRFNGKTSEIRASHSDITTTLQNTEFTISLWASTEVQGHETAGDLLRILDAANAHGVRLGIDTHAGVTNAQSNLRQLQFGIQSNSITPEFQDHGRPGQSVYVFSLCVHDGRLYAATCEAGENQKGHVYRFEKDQQWTDLGSPDEANAISAMAVFEDQLYVASSKYRLAGSSLPESPNPSFGGRVFRLSKEDRWEPCGRLSEDTEAVASLIDYRGALYASSLYRPAGFFKFDGGQSWTPMPTPEGKRVEAMTVFNDRLYATSYDEGSVFRFDGERWETVTRIPNATQTYGFGIHQGKLFVSEWPQAHVFRMDSFEANEWTDTGKLGQELEAMPLLTHNGALYCGSLPSAEVYRYDGRTAWERVGRVDHTPDVKYRRAWSMAVYKGRLFVGTLPSGRIQSMDSGPNVTWDTRFPDGWHHIAAVRRPGRLELFVDGKCVSMAAVANHVELLLKNAQLTIGSGAQDHFQGELSDIQIFRTALSEDQISRLAKP